MALRGLANGIFFAISLAGCTPESTSSAGAADGHVSIIVEPSDNGGALIAAIRQATVSVHVTLYILTDKELLAALIARAAAGVEVKVVLNQNFPGGSYNPNTNAYDALRAATPSVAVVWAPARFTYAHEKCVVIDAAVAWVMTMNGAAASLRSNREYLAVDSVAADVAQAEAQFAADFFDIPYTAQGALLVAPGTMRAGLHTLVAQATRTLDFAAEEISDGGMASDFCSAVARGVIVRGVLSDAAPSPTQISAQQKLGRCGVSLVILSRPYMHAKALVADGARAYVGSANYTYVSLEQNRELGLVTSDTAAVATVADTIASDIAAGTALQPL